MAEHRPMAHSYRTRTGIVGVDLVDIPVDYMEATRTTNNMTNYNNSRESISGVLLMHERLEFLAAMWLVKYAFMFTIVAGSVGNILSFLVLIRKRMRGTTINFYLAYLACADTMVLYASGFKTWLRVVSDFELLHASAFACKLLTFVFMVFLHVSAWLIVLVTLDRFLAVWFPFKAAIWCSPRRSRIIAVVMTILVLVYNAHLFWTIVLQDLGVMGGRVIKQCAPLESNHFMNGAFNYVKFATYSIIPFILVIAMNMGIIVKICQHSRKSISDPSSIGMAKSDGDRSGMEYSSTVRIKTAENRVQSSRQQVTMMLLLVSFVWLIFTLPFTVISTIHIEYPDERSRASTFLAKTCCFLLMYTNHSINFLLYCIAGKRFRKELAAMFNDICSLCKRNRGGFNWKERSLRTRSKRTAQTPMVLHLDNEEYPLKAVP